jgi:DNA-3-methyladenine glycosylase II
MLYSATGLLTPTPPFDFAKSLDFLGFFGPTEGEQAISARGLAKAVLAEDQTVVFQLEPAGSVEKPELNYTLFSDRPIGEVTRRAVAERAAFFLSLADDLRRFYAIGRADSAFAPIVERLYGYHQVKFLTPFENACWAVLTQRNPIPIARQIKQAIVERFGGRLDLDGERYWAFPTAARLAAADPAELLDLIRNQRRAEYLHAIALAFSDVSEEWLRTAPYDEVESWLRGIKGIGAWSASFVLLRGLGRMEKVPIGEGRLSDAVSKIYGRGRALNDTEIQQIAERYGAWQGYWAHYLRVNG